MTSGTHVNEAAGFGAFTQTVIDPETGKELEFSADSEVELDALVEDHFDPPGYDPETGEHGEDI